MSTPEKLFSGLSVLSCWLFLLILFQYTYSIYYFWSHYFSFLCGLPTLISWVLSQCTVSLWHFLLSKCGGQWVQLILSQGISPLGQSKKFLLLRRDVFLPLTPTQTHNYTHLFPSLTLHQLWKLLDPLSEQS